jgi:sugar/nucleoside kinase (ribokinase family)
VSSAHVSPSALFAGLCTLDIIQAVDRVPGPNEKVTALDQTVAAGGPAANAAVTFAFLGGHATLLTGAGRHPLAEGIRADLARAGVRLIDAAEADVRPPPVSSILVTAGTGDRSVVSRNAAGRELAPPPELSALAGQARAVLIDGHHPMLAHAAARAARDHGRPCILDGGSWKDNTADILPYVDVAVCSADFRPPGAAGDVLAYLLGSGIRWAAVTDGPRPVTWAGLGARSGTVPVPAVDVADTLGAGDVFHGALTHAIAAHGALDEDAFTSALRFAAEVAARSCRSFGTRAWMD